MKTCFLSFFCFFSIICFAQTDSLTAPPKTYSEYRTELDYSSNNTYKSQRDTSNIPILTPSFRYLSKKKYYVQGTLVNGRETKTFVDEFDFKIGKKFTFNKKWSGNLSYSHYFYGSTVKRIKTVVSNNIFGVVNYDWDILYSQLMIDFSGGNKNFKVLGKALNKKTTDVTFTFANSHQYDFKLKKGAIAITPEIDVLIGTQNYMTIYLGKTDVSKSANKVIQKQASKLALTGYMITIDARYTLNRFTFDISPYYTIPKHTLIASTNTPYFVLSASVFFTIKK